MAGKLKKLKGVPKGNTFRFGGGSMLYIVLAHEKWGVTKYRAKGDMYDRSAKADGRVYETDSRSWVYQY